MDNPKNPLLTQFKEVMLDAFGRLPEELLQKDPQVLALGIHDVLQGFVQERQIQALVETGLPRQQAKDKVIPCRSGGPYLQVQEQMQNLPTSLAIGGAQIFGSHRDLKKIPEPLSRYHLRKRTLDVVCGVSVTDGGGPGFMEEDSVYSQQADKVVAEMGLNRAFTPVVAQVLLKIGKEAPNGFGSTHHVVWTVDSLVARTNMLISLGKLLSVQVFPGGFGTREEVSRILIDNQLLSQVRTVIPHIVPVVYVDYQVDSRTNYYDHVFRDFDLQLKAGAIDEKHLDPVKRVHVDDPKAVEKAVAIDDEQAKAVLGYSLIDDWHERNPGADLFETVDTIVARIENGDAPAPLKMAIAG